MVGNRVVGRQVAATKSSRMGDFSKRTLWRDCYRYRFQSTKKPVTSLQQPDHYRRCVKGLGIPPYRSTSTKALSTSSTFQRSFSFPASRSTRDRSALKYVPSVLPLARVTRVS